MRILVTGGNGFIGRYVQSRIKELGGVSYTFDTTAAIWHDVTDYEALREYADAVKPTGIIHLAGMLGTHELWDTTDDAIDVNIKGALNVARVAMELDIKMVSIEQPHIWYNVYEATKFAARRMLTGLAMDQGLRVDFVTAHNAFGPGQAYGEGHPQKIIPTFATLAWQGEPIPIWGNGTQKVNLVYAGDVAQLLVDRVLEPTGGPEGLFQAGTDSLLSVSQVANVIINHVESRGAGRNFLEHLPMRRGEQGGAYPEPDVTYPFRLSWSQLFRTVDTYKPEDM